MMKSLSECNKYFFVIFFLAVIYVVFLMVQPFVGALLSAAVLAYVFHPVYRFVLKKTGRENLSAFIVAVLVIFLISLPSIFIINTAASESQYLYVRAKQKLTTGDIIGGSCQGQDGVMCRYSRQIGDFLAKPEVRYHLEETIKRMAMFFSESASSFILSIPSMVLFVFITFFVMFYLLKEGGYLVRKAVSLTPFRNSHQQKLVKNISEMTFAVVYGTVIIALLQGVVAAVGFHFIGIGSALVFGMITTAAAILPFVGTAIVWVPVSLSLIIGGLSLGSSSLAWQGVALAVYGVLVISTIDNIVGPHIIGKKAGMHPVLVFLGAIGGIYLLGFIGFIIGPVIMALFVLMLEIYKSEKDGVECFA